MAHDNDMDARETSVERLEGVDSRDIAATTDTKTRVGKGASGRVAKRSKAGGEPAGSSLGGSFAELLKRLPGTSGKRTRAWVMWRNAAVIVLVYVVAVNLGYFLVLKPSWRRLDELRADKMIMQDFLVVRESSAAVAGFRNEMMRGDQRMTIIAELEPMAREAGVRIIGEPTLLSSKEISGKIVEYPIELKLECTYHELGNFISMLEVSSRFFAVREVEFDDREDEKGRDGRSITLVVGIASWEE